MSSDFLGIGWSFPLEFRAGRVQTADHEESIRQSIRLILETGRGERVMRPDFGCGLHDRVFALNNAATHGGVRDDVREALLQWEPRIDVLQVNVAEGGTAGEVLLIDIDYRVRATDSRFNLVYPFYLHRGGI